MNSREIKNIDINEITEEHIFLGFYEENSKESSENWLRTIRATVPQLHLGVSKFE
jgi:hypothetical protein